MNHSPQPAHTSRQSLAAATAVAVAVGLATFGLSGRASSSDEATSPSPVTVIRELEFVTQWASSLSHESLSVAVQADSDLGSPDLTRMYLTEDALDGQSYAFPIGGHGICLLRVLKVDLETHTVRTCAATAAILTRGLALHVSLVGGGGKILNETVMVLPDGYEDLIVDGSKVGAVSRNFVRWPAMGNEHESASVRGPAGEIAVGSFTD